jgi:enediyne biosynthesis protein E3
MGAILGPLRRRLFGIRARELDFDRRGFRGSDPAMRRRLEHVGRAFASGYHAALEEDELETLVITLNSIDADLRGFAYEGAAMGLALLDFLTPGRKDRVRSFLSGAGKAHAYMVHVGVGWMLARIPGGVEQRLEQFDPLLRWLVLDGYGFHEGFFHGQRYLGGQPAPAGLAGYAHRAFDQGFGRCLWFIDGGEVAGIPQSVTAFPLKRRADLWSGVGLAATYAGEVSQSELASLRESAGRYVPCLAQGSAFAAKARLRAGIAVPYTDRATMALCGLSAAEAAQLTDDALQALPLDGAEPAYEIWRQRVQAQFASLVTSGRGAHAEAASRNTPEPTPE